LIHFYKRHLQSPCLQKLILMKRTSYSQPLPTEGTLELRAVFNFLRSYLQLEGSCLVMTLELYLEPWCWSGRSGDFPTCGRSS